MDIGGGFFFGLVVAELKKLVISIVDLGIPVEVPFRSVVGIFFCWLLLQYFLAFLVNWAFEAFLGNWDVVSFLLTAFGLNFECGLALFSYDR